ncbi:unnamed protein product [Phytophthora fragariaefolia]|uniref:Unnamed protein product n=1 Tax=Phytophthora fragariaefolia TaxID=1490495 RepID=A0A9W7DEN1_9STRA|nr:unnamed protein product [Phytophthora fragariaefolia]
MGHHINPAELNEFWTPEVNLQRMDVRWNDRATANLTDEHVHAGTGLRVLDLSVSFKWSWAGIARDYSFAGCRCG